MSGWHLDIDGTTLMRRLLRAGVEPGVKIYHRDTDDGFLCCVVAPPNPIQGWHLSISCNSRIQTPNGRNQPLRYPTWDEIKEARYRFLPLDLLVGMILPPQEEYVDVHETCFHLFELQDGRLPKVKRETT